MFVSLDFGRKGEEEGWGLHSAGSVVAGGDETVVAARVG